MTEGPRQLGAANVFATMIKSDLPGSDCFLLLQRLAALMLHGRAQAARARHLLQHVHLTAQPAYRTSPTAWLYSGLRLHGGPRLRSRRFPAGDPRVLHTMAVPGPPVVT